MCRVAFQNSRSGWGRVSSAQRGRPGEQSGNHTMIHEAGGPRIRGQQNKKESVAVTDFEVEGAQEKKEKRTLRGPFPKSLPS